MKPGIIDPDEFFKEFGGRTPNLHRLILPESIEKRIVYDDQNKYCDLCRDIRMLVFEDENNRGYINYEEIMRHPRLVKHLTEIWPEFPPRSWYR
jgi:hypothetical protein